MSTPETIAKVETVPPVVVKDDTTPPPTSPTTGSNSDYLNNTAESQPDPKNLTPSTRPDAERMVSALSNATPPPSTPEPVVTTATRASGPAAPIAPAAVSSTTPAHPVTVEDEQELDPKVASLQAIFPSFDAAVLQSVLEISDGDESQAIETLLSMSDPEYKPSATPHQHHDQTDLDEQLAHRLHLEEQARADYEARHGGARPIPGARTSGHTQQTSEPGTLGGVDMGAIGAQVKGFLSGAAAKVSSSGLVRGGVGNTQQQGGAVGSPPNVNTAELRQQFNEFAETGKKHFNTLMTKVKAKMQEYDIPGPGQPGGVQQTDYNSYGQGNPTVAYGSQSNQRPQQKWYPQQPVGIQPQPAIHTPANQQQQQPPVVGYHVDPPTPVVPPKDTLPSVGPRPSGSDPAASGALGVSQPGMQQRSSFDQTDAPRPTFDTSRLGLKPKRPVSLVGNNNGIPLTPSAVSKGKNKAEDDDDIEYEISR